MKLIRISFCVRLLVVLCLILDGIVCQDCESKETCGQCIQEFKCFWCIGTVANDGNSHCIPKVNLKSCNANNTEDPQTFYEKVDPGHSTESEQLSPRKVKLKLRRNEKYEINFSYKQSNNYPVDLYYLMDVSNSMAPSKEQLANLGKDLATEMRKKTNNFMIGFGSFVDKLTLPFVNTHPAALLEPCQNCAPPYSFTNHLSLQLDAELFSKRVRETKLSGNLDTPEGGLDAIMQAMVCESEIGWRQDARHLLVMSTDAVSHIAGDGKLGGVIEPNDAQCHMLENKTYTHGLVYDYPSVSQINYVARQKNINIIFAIVTKTETDPEHLTKHYEAMSNVIKNSKSGTLNKNSNNVVKFISDIYDEIRYSVRITSDATKDVSVNIIPRCPNFINGACSNVRPGDTLDFTAVIEPLICHKDAKSNKHTIKIKPEGLRDSLIVELEVYCDCKCAEDKKINNTLCEAHGNLECGICRCNEGRFGQTCQCTRQVSKTEDSSVCIKPDGKNLICSGNGKCFCGQCLCKEYYSGKFCECDNQACGNPECSGHGKCNCGKCECDTDWTKDTCYCSKDTSKCFAPNSNRICSGHGNCTCGTCECDVNGSYDPEFCEIRKHKKSCKDHQFCVECLAYNTEVKVTNSNCTEQCNNYTVTTVEKLEEGLEEAAEKCIVVENNCDIRFTFLEGDKDMYMITAEKNKVCRKPVPLFIWISGVIATVLLIGIITLIAWKVITTIHDKSEYAKFLSERDETQFGGENPLYKPGTSHFQNPAYLRASQRFSVMKDMRKSQKVPVEGDVNSKKE